MTTHEHPGFGFLEQGHLVLLALQLGLGASILISDGMDGLRSGLLVCVALTGGLLAFNRRLAGDERNRSAAPWVVAWRIGVLATLAVITLVAADSRQVWRADPERTS